MVQRTRDLASATSDAINTKTSVDINLDIQTAVTLKATIQKAGFSPKTEAKFLEEANLRSLSRSVVAKSPEPEQFRKKVVNIVDRPGIPQSDLEKSHSFAETYTEQRMAIATYLVQEGERTKNREMFESGVELAKNTLPESEFRNWYQTTMTEMIRNGASRSFITEVSRELGFSDSFIKSIMNVTIAGDAVNAIQMRERNAEMRQNSIELAKVSDDYLDSSRESAGESDSREGDTSFEKSQKKALKKVFKKAS